MNRNIYFVILTYNPSIELLRSTLSIVKNFPTLIIDNSVDEKVERELWKLKRENVDVIVNSKNLGYSGGMNVGMKDAFSKGADWVVLLNDDVTLSKIGIDELIDILSSQAPGIVGPWGGYLDTHRWTTIYSSKENSKPKKDPDYISGAFMALHKDIYTLTQGFYPDYFMYYEDVDLCSQAKKAGYPLVEIHVPDISHEEGKSIEQGSQLHEYYLARNHLLFVERQAPLPIKLREFIRLPKTLWEHHYFMNTGALRGDIDFLFLRFGKATIQ